MSEIIENFVLTIHKRNNILPEHYSFYEFPYQLDIGNDSQITWYSNNQYLFILYGEITNFEELASENHLGMVPKFHIIITLFEKYGMKFFDRFRGRHASILIDKTKRCAYICKDYIGSKALYYFESNEAIYITSHAKNLKFLAPVNRSYINKMLNGERIYGNETVFDGVKCVPTGSVMLLIETKKIYFYKLNYNISIIRYKKNSEYYEHFYELLQKILNKNIGSNVAFTISGGLDCTLLSYIFSRISKQQIQAYTFDLSSYGKSSEEIYLRDIEKSKKININYVTLKDKFLESIIANNYDEPNHYILTNAWNIMLNKCKLKEVSSLVTGFGGDEITVGYDDINKLQDVSPKVEHSFLSLNENGSNPYTNSKSLYTGQIYYSNVKIPLNTNSSYVKIYNRLFSGDIGRLIYRYEQDCFEKKDIKFILPFLERDIIEFSLGIPIDIHIDKEISKNLQRKAGHGVIPKSIEKRKEKSDFFHWYIIELLKQYDFVQDLISNSIVLNEDYCSGNIIEIVRKFYSKSNINYFCRKEYASQLLDFIAVELWLKNLKSGK